MNIKKLTLAILFTLTSQTALSATPVIEERGLTKVKPLQAQPSKEWQMYQRIKKQDIELAQLRDKIERLEAQLSKFQKKSETRLYNIEGKVTSHEASILALTTESDEPEGNITSAKSAPAANKGTAKNQITSQESSEKTPLKPVDEDAAKKDYLAAYDAFKKSGAKAGISGMNQFIRKHSGSQLVPSAHYWAGEFHLSDSKPDLSAAELRFATVANRYPKDAKAPRALYRLANLADANGKTTTAKGYMKKLVDNYPDAKEASLAKNYLKSK